VTKYAHGVMGGLREFRLFWLSLLHEGHVLAALSPGGGGISEGPLNTRLGGPSAGRKVVKRSNNFNVCFPFVLCVLINNMQTPSNNTFYRQINVTCQIWKQFPTWHIKFCILHTQFYLFLTFLYKVVQIWQGLFVCKQVTVCPGHIWTTSYFPHYPDDD
jgi:hypothetical protein